MSFYFKNILQRIKEFLKCLIRRIPILIILSILWVVLNHYYEDIVIEICWSIISIIFIDCIIDTNKNIDNKKVVNIVKKQLNRIFSSIEILFSNQYDCVRKTSWDFKNNEENINLICENLNLETIVPNLIPKITRRNYIHNFSKTTQLELDWILDRYITHLSPEMITKIDDFKNAIFFRQCSNSLIFFMLKDLGWGGFQEAYKDLLEKMDELKKECK